jgi:hypothetical protein
MLAYTGIWLKLHKNKFFDTLFYIKCTFDNEVQHLGKQEEKAIPASKSVNQLMSTDKIQFINVSLYLANTPVAIINVKLPEVRTFHFVHV